MSKGFGETLTRDMGKRLENHLSNGRPLQREEAMLLNISLWPPHTDIYTHSWSMHTNQTKNIPCNQNNETDAGSFDDSDAVK